MKPVFKFNMYRKILSQQKGFSYIEFLLMLFVLMGMIYIFIQIYGLINAQILVQNTAKDALRRVELAGGAVYTDPIRGGEVSVLDDAINELKGISNIDADSVSIYLNGQKIDSAAIDPNAFKYQIREPIKLVLTAKYNFINLSGLTTAMPLESGITLSATYQGASEKFMKSKDYEPLMD